MTGINELAAVVRAGLAEDERVARAASEGPWSVDSESYAETVYGHGSVEVVAGGRWGGEASVFESTEDAVHIARHHPARVLADVAGRRALVDALLAEPHAVQDDDGWYSCSQAGEDCWDSDRRGDPCDCGRDDRVRSYLQHLARPYQEDSRG